jgi:hypothetical protein
MSLSFYFGPRFIAREPWTFTLSKSFPVVKTFLAIPLQVQPCELAFSGSLLQSYLAHVRTLANYPTRSTRAPQLTEASH